MLFCWFICLFVYLDIIFEEREKREKKEDKIFYSNNGKVNLFFWYLKVVRIGGKIKMVMNCKDKIMEKFVYICLC